MKIGSLCTGYGGLDMAVQSIFDGDLAWYAEYDKHASKIMAHHEPDVENLKDLTQIAWDQIEPVDILTAGYPCQPFSQAGKREGTNDPRHLFPHIAKAISTIRPSLVILENVRGHLTLGFDTVLGELAAIGYDARWHLVRASDVGAPHQRARLFIVAYANDGQPIGELPRLRVGHTPRSNLHMPTGYAQTLTHSDCDACRKPQRTDRKVFGAGAEERNGSDWQESWCGCEDDTNTDSIGRLDTEPRSNRDQGQPQFGFGDVGAFDWQHYEPAIRLWEHRTGRPAPEPIEDNRLSVHFVEWLMGLPDGHVTGIDLPYAQVLKALGNGVVPQQAYHAIQLLTQ